MDCNEATSMPQCGVKVSKFINLGTVTAKRVGWSSYGGGETAEAA